MKSETSILRRIEKNKITIRKFRSGKNAGTLDREYAKRAIFTLQEINRELKWVLR